jgi:DNA-binding NarL/FixJ family response regulator
VTDPVRLVVADDQALVRTGFRMILTADGIDVVAEASTGHEAIDAVRRTRPDVVLMDIRMPALDGLEATRRILAADGDAPRVLMLTTFDLDEYVYAALAAGASGFLLKDVSPEQLTAAVMLVRSGDALLAPSITRRLVERFAGRGQEESVVHRDLAALTPREREVLQMLARGRATPSSPPRSSSRRRPSRRTWRGSWGGCSCATGSRRSWSPTRRAWSHLGRREARLALRPPESPPCCWRIYRRRPLGHF